MIRSLLVFTALLCSMNVRSAEPVLLEGISILGSAEEANIMTITSWKSPPDMEVPFEHLSGSKQDLMEPLHPKRFQLEVDYARKYRNGSMQLKKPGNLD